MSSRPAKTILITGATDGIGLKTAEILITQGHKVIVHGRNIDKAKAVVQEFKNQFPNSEVDSVVFDLSSLDSVRLGADELNAKYSAIDVLINNAGTYQTERKSSIDGFELTMAINHLGPVLFTQRIKGLLASAESKVSRVVNVSSIAHGRGGWSDFDFNFEHSFSPYGAYAASKLANVIMAQVWSQQWADEGIASYSLHPGVITTKLLKMGFNMEGASTKEGSQTSVYLATQEISSELNGGYFVDQKPALKSRQANDQKIISRLLEWTMNSINKK